MPPSSLSEPELAPLLGEDPAFLDALDHASRLARIDRPCLVIGERGTGKELVATRLHMLSPRWSGPLVKVNCAALPETLLESELFGHEAGAFTGARTRHRGRFERADGGTLFLDEIATARQRVQEQVLRVIEYGEFERLGGEGVQRVDVRIVAATNVDLPAMADKGTFRADLLDRLAFDVVTLPPLRARPADIHMLADEFATRMARALGYPPFAGFTAAVRAKLAAHTWPGNVRELRNVVERSLYRAGAVTAPLDTVILDPFDSPWRPTGTKIDAMPAPQEPLSEPVDFTQAVAIFERQLIVDALSASEGHQGQAATRLGLGYHQLRRLLKKHAVDG
jgi:psp operon transcriptional activator